ncbi:MAG: hypothetical protein KDK36_20385, partial [Leptospiraceae bacterium]|nr:hypothetical protein [Leptospiraceae bacterium]
NNEERYLGTETKYKDNTGIKRIGKFSLVGFLAEKGKQGFSDSEIKVLSAISSNEGLFDALNTYDGAFLSFGIQQWNLGGGSNPGELPALLMVLKDKFPNTFNKFFGKYGMDINIPKNGQTGFLLLDGRILKDPIKKKEIQENIWLLRFMKAGQDYNVAYIQMEYSINRLKMFYTIPNKNLDSYALSDLLTSEYSVAQLLDTHVNRPAFVYGLVKKTLIELNLRPVDLINKEIKEFDFMEKFLKLRKDYTEKQGQNPMTHSTDRGNSIKSKGLLTDKETYKSSML